MNAADLDRLLKNGGIHPGSYSLDGTHPPYEGLVLTKQGDAWLIRHFEKGIWSDLEAFDTEPEACARLFTMLTGKKSPRVR